jgi:PAS domain S-box-containing protein
MWVDGSSMTTTADQAHEQRELRESRERLRGARAVARFSSRLQARLLDEVDAAVVATDLDGHVTHWNDGAQRLYGWSRAETIGRFVMEFIAPQDGETAAALGNAAASTRRWEGEYDVRRKDGSIVPSDHRLSPLDDEHGVPIGIIGVSVDISERRRAAAELRSARDHLRAVTDSMGEGLYSVDDAGRLTYMNSAAEGLLGWTAAELLGQTMHEVIHPRRPDGAPFPVEHVRVEDDFFTRKDGSELPVAYTSAPFEADTGIRGSVVVFGDATERRAQQALLERDLDALSCIERIRDALESDRFVLHAQPIIDVTSGEPVRHELLIRMLDETGAVVLPQHFLPVAEEFGLIRDIDRWVIRQAAEVAAYGHPIAVNLSAESLGDPMLLAFVEHELTRTGAAPADIVFELTETGLLREEDSARSFIEGVTRMGSHVALDDFGTGYGGLSYVKRLPVDFLKIDVEFVRDLAQNPASRHVIRAVVNLARDFGHRTIAEGVEDHETLGLLRGLGVDFAQGYAIGRPAPLDQMLPIQANERHVKA